MRCRESIVTAAPPLPPCSNHALSKPKCGGNARQPGTALPSFNGHGAKAQTGTFKRLFTIIDICGKHYI
jgi:hypothetical protein